MTVSILVGDVGGTNVRFAIAMVSGRDMKLGPVWKRPGADFTTFEDAVSAFRAENNAKLDGASFGFAGPVFGDRVELLHRKWTIKRSVQANLLGVSRIVMVNDFMAMARSAPDLGPDATESISPGKLDMPGSLAVGGPGTGFGIAILRRLIGAEGWVVVGGEGGHQAYGPQTDLDWQVYQRLKAKLGYISNEMVASGSGFADAYAALAAVMGKRAGDATEADVLAAAGQGDELAQAFCRLRARTVMTVMGNMALLSMSGGVFIAGGISTRIASYLREREALDCFYQRGPRTGLLAGVPIRLITTEAAPLIGAAHLWLDEEARGWL